MEDTRIGVTGILARAQLVGSLGDGAFYVTSAVYFTTVAGLAPAQVGIGLTCAWTLGFLASAPLGHAADRMGMRRTAAALAVVTAVALCALGLAGSFPAFVVATSCYAVAQSGLGAVRQAMLVQLVSEAERVHVRARLQVAANAGIGLGAAAGGLALLSGTTEAFLAVFLADAAAYLLTGALLLRLPRPVSSGAPTPLQPGTAKAVLADRRFVTATALNAVLYLYMPVLSVLSPLWVAGHTAAPLWSVAALFVLNTAGVMAAQRRAANRVTGLPSAARSVRRGGCLIGIACLGLWAAAVPDDAAPAALVLMLAAALLTAGEVLLAAGSWEIGFALADPQRPGQWQGLYSSGVPAARALGPTVLVALVIGWSGPGWLVLSAIFAAAGLALAATAWRSVGRLDASVPHPSS